MDFSSVKLKKTAAPEPRKVLTAALCENDEQYQELMKDTFLEEYLDKLALETTFETFVLPLDQMELHSAHERKAWKESNLLKKLVAEIDSEMEKRAWPLIFVRLSSRSPKDAALKAPRFKSLLQSHYDDACAQVEIPGRNEKLLALYGASTEVMGCRNGSEAMDLLVASDRVQDDLVTMKGLNVCIRRFCRFRPELEVRGFVWDGKLTALTQYNQFVVSKRLQSSFSAVQKACISCFETSIRPKIDLQRYSIDFVVLDSGEALVVEINPLAEFTGMGLFQWDESIDQQCIMGITPFEFRIAMKEPEALDINGEYADILNNWGDHVK